MTRATTEYPERCLHEVWEELTARGFVVDEPGISSCQCFIHNLRDAQCEMDLLVTGALVWVYTPLAGTCPEQTVRLVLPLLGHGPASDRLPPARRGLPLMEAAGQMLTDAGMTAQPAEICYDVDEVHTEVVVTNPADQARGQVRISETGSIYWECFFTSPGSSAAGLPPRDVAQAITAALVEYRAGGQGGTGDSGPDGAAVR
jgi:hypothetical protein